MNPRCFQTRSIASSRHGIRSSWWGYARRGRLLDLMTWNVHRLSFFDLSTDLLLINSSHRCLDYWVITIEQDEIINDWPCLSLNAFPPSPLPMCPLLCSWRRNQSHTHCHHLVCQCAFASSWWHLCPEPLCQNVWSCHHNRSRLLVHPTTEVSLQNDMNQQ